MIKIIRIKIIGYETMSFNTLSLMKPSYVPLTLSQGGVRRKKLLSYEM